jgi:hypothetical protein
VRFDVFRDDIESFQIEIERIGRRCPAKRRAEVLKIMRYLRDGLPMTESAIRTALVCLCVLHERYAADAA